MATRKSNMKHFIIKYDNGSAMFVDAKTVKELKDKIKDPNVDDKNAIVHRRTSDGMGYIKIKNPWE